MRRLLQGCLALCVAFAGALAARDVPDDIAIRAFVKPDGQRLHVLVRLPFRAVSGLNFPLRGANGELDLTRVNAMLPSAARWWIAEYIDVYEGDSLLSKPAITASRVSLPSDNSFASYDAALAHIQGLPLTGDAQVFRDQAMLDVLLDYSIRSEQSSLAIHSRLARLADRTSTDLFFIAPGGGLKEFEYQGDPGLFRLDPNWSQTVAWFAPLGFFHLLKGSDYLLFLFCAVLLLRNFAALVPFALAFTIAHSTTLIAAAYNLGSDALWFPVLIGTIIAASTVYMAFENIAGGAVRPPWILAMAFGFIYGFGFSFALRPALQFAGTHVLISILSFNAGVELAKLLVLLLLVPVLSLILRFAVARRTETIVLAALAADIAWHRTTDRVTQLSQFTFQWPAFDAALLANAMRWMAILLVGSAVVFLALGALRQRTPKPAPKEGDSRNAELPYPEQISSR